MAYTGVANARLSFMSGEDITISVNFVLKVYNNIDLSLWNEMIFLCDQDIIMSVSSSDNASLILLGRLSDSEKIKNWRFDILADV